MVIAVAAPSLCQAQSASSVWPTFHHDTKHTGLSDIDTSTNPGDLKWTFGSTFEMGPADLVFSSPAIGTDGTIYIGLDQSLCAVNPDGSEKWKFTTGGLVASSPAIASDGTIYFGSQDSHLYAITDAGTGATQKWAFAIADLADAPPTIRPDGTVYIGGHQHFYAVNPAGTLKWVLPNGGIFNSAAAIGVDDTVYVGGFDGNLYAMTDGGQGSAAIKWTFGAGFEIASSPAIGADGTIYFESGDGTVFALTDDGASAIKKWTFSTGPLNDPDLWASPAIGSDGTIYTTGGDGRFYALTDAGTNAIEKWIFDPGPYLGAYSSSPAIGADGTIYVSSGELVALTDIGSSATVKWILPSNTDFSSPAIGPDGTIYAGTEYDNLDAVGTAPSPVSARLKIAPARLTFGTIRQGKTRSLKITVTNPKGTRKKPGVSVQMQGRSIEGFNSPFSVTNGCLGSLSPGAKCQITVTFKPDLPGLAKYALSLYDNADLNPQSVVLRGRGR